MQQQDSEVLKRQRTLTVLWLAMLFNVVLLFIVTQMASPDSNESAPNKILTVVLTAAGTFLVIISFAVKQKFLRLSVDRQKIDVVQTAYIIAWALAETAAMFGMVDRFVTGNSSYYLLFLIAAAGIGLQFPRRDHLLAANYKTDINNL